MTEKEDAGALVDGDVHVHVLEVEGFDEEAASSLLSVAELESSLRFRFPRHRREYVATRALARITLARYVQRPPESLTFERSARGRPWLLDAGAVQFNLSNTPGRVVCAVTRGCEVGVDVEPLARAEEILRVAPAVLRDTEIRDLESLDNDARRGRAVALWTGKEAYLKARGSGFAISPSSFALHFSASGVTLDLVDVEDDSAARWAVSIHRDGAYCTSVCVGRRSAPPRVLFHHHPLDQNVPRTPAP